jgi:hypothetical protein
MTYIRDFCRISYNDDASAFRFNGPTHFALYAINRPHDISLKLGTIISSSEVTAVLIHVSTPTYKLS